LVKVLFRYIGVGAVSNIVIIEEDDLLRGLVKEWLSAEGHTVVERRLCAPSSGAHADLVIVDLYMPRWTGCDVVDAVKQAHPGAAVIAMSGQFSSGLARSRRTAQMLGARQLLVKPFTRLELLSAVRAAIAATV
jgi:DNA-binding response OmpR family regulator